MDNDDNLGDDFNTNTNNNDIPKFDKQFKPNIPGSPEENDSDEGESKEQMQQEKNIYMKEKLQKLYKNQ